jgi:SAM-dependent methyltransferase
LGEARNLEFEDNYFDMVLLFGPLYHLIEKEDRIAALLEAKRVTNSGGRLFCATISRLAFLFDVFFHDIVKVNCQTISAIERHIRTGQIRNSGEQRSAFTTAYAHQSGELREEIAAASLNIDRLIAIDGFGWLTPDFEKKWQQDEYRESLLSISQKLESDESIIGMSAHIMAIAVKS